jgi:ribonuclease P protein component
MSPNSDPSPSDPRRFPFPREFRLRSTRDFERIYALKQKAADANLLIFAARNQRSHLRLGLSVSRRHGNSVQRHRLRRLLREAVRLEQHQLPAGLDLILIPGRESASATIADLRASVVKLARKLSQRLP